MNVHIRFGPKVKFISTTREYEVLFEHTIKLIVPIMDLTNVIPITTNV
jgi:hypothetical protein